MMISSADHHDLSGVCPAQSYEIVGQSKGGPLQPVGEGSGVEGAPVAPTLPTSLVRNLLLAPR